MPTVLLVEDDPSMRALITEVLSERGLTVHAAPDDRTALRILDREGPQIAVLVADVHLGPGATGPDVARRARRLNPRMQVVYVTGASREMEEIGVEGAVLLPKPFHVTTLADMVEALADGGLATP